MSPGQELGRTREIVSKAREVSARAEADMRRLLRHAPHGEAAEPGRRRPTVLLVEDDAATRLAVESWLSLKGFSVEAAGSGSEAAERLDDPKGDIDVAVVDIGLPDVSGTALCEVIGQFHPRLPVVVCSGRATAEDVRRVREAGVRQFCPNRMPLPRGVARLLSKPVGCDEVLAALSDLLETLERQVRATG